MVSGMLGQTQRQISLKTGEMENIQPTWMTQISFGSTIIFPNSVVIKISPCWGTAHTNRQRETQRKENLNKKAGWCLSYHCSYDRWQRKQQQRSFPHQSESLRLSCWSTWNKNKIRSKEGWKCFSSIKIYPFVTYFIHSHLSTMEVLQVYTWTPMPLRDLASPAPQTVCKPWNVEKDANKIRWKFS